MKARYLMHTQSNRKGDVVEFDSTSVNQNQLLKRGIIALIQEAPKVETKVVTPKETKPARKVTKK